MSIRALRRCAVPMGMLFAVIVVAALAGGLWSGPASADDDDRDYEAGEIVVKLDPTAGGEIAKINAAYATTTLERLSGSAGIYLLRLPPGRDPGELRERMAGDPRLLYAEPNFVAETPEGGGRHRAFGERATAQPSDQYAAGSLNLACAGGISRGGGTVVAVLDTGVQSDHPALESSQTRADHPYDFVDDDHAPADAPNGVDEDGDGAVDEMVGHGLVAPEAEIMPLRVLDTEGYGNVFLIAEAISYAERKGADVINLSLGTPGRSELLQDTIRAATSEGVAVVAAAGNSNTSAAQYPASGKALAVTSVGRDGVKSSFANFGGWVDVAAPGEEIHSAFPIDDYAYWSGTSMSAPFVAGQAALLRSENPALSTSGLLRLIRETARPLDDANPPHAGKLGTGHADIGASLERLRPDAGCEGAPTGDNAGGDPDEEDD